MCKECCSGFWHPSHAAWRMILTTSDFWCPSEVSRQRRNCCSQTWTGNKSSYRFLHVFTMFWTAYVCCAFYISKHYLLYHSTQQERVSMCPYVRPTICLEKGETCQRFNTRKAWWGILIWDSALFGLQVESAKWDLTILVGACCQSQRLMYRANFGATLHWRAKTASDDAPGI